MKPAAPVTRYRMRVADLGRSGGRLTIRRCRYRASRTDGTTPSPLSRLGNTRGGEPVAAMRRRDTPQASYGSGQLQVELGLLTPAREFHEVRVEEGVLVRYSTTRDV